MHSKVAEPASLRQERRGGDRPPVLTNNSQQPDQPGISMTEMALCLLDALLKFKLLVVISVREESIGKCKGLLPPERPMEDAAKDRRRLMATRSLRRTVRNKAKRKMRPSKPQDSFPQYGIQRKRQL